MRYLAQKIPLQFFAKGHNSRKGYNPDKNTNKGQLFFHDRKFKQENHGSRFAHLSDIATDVMQHFSNPIITTNETSFEQFLVLKQNIWA